MYNIILVFLLLLDIGPFTAISDLINVEAIGTHNAEHEHEIELIRLEALATERAREMDVIAESIESSIPTNVLSSLRSDECFSFYRKGTSKRDRSTVDVDVAAWKRQRLVTWEDVVIPATPTCCCHNCCPLIPMDKIVPQVEKGWCKDGLGSTRFRSWPCAFDQDADKFVAENELRCVKGVFSLRHRFLYVDNHKTGSSSIRSFLKEHFQAEFDCKYHDVEMGLRAACRRNTRDPPRVWGLVSREPHHTKTCGLLFDKTVKGTRAVTDSKYGSVVHLNPRDFFIFTLVRNPVSRFVSGFMQASLKKCQIPMEWYTRGRETNEAFNNRVEQMVIQMEKGLRPNEHVQSQSLQLSGTDAAGRPLPYNFIGRVETMHRDWRHILKHICAHADPEFLANMPSDHPCRNPTRTPLPSDNVLHSEKKHLSPELTRRVCKMLHQDFTCFGYDLPSECDTNRA
eukprot:TRINITY_DN7262_c0_g1_i2.p1 TRINITY_DN7262_c0_g1~~TRINITY_DN7262_c0_g1_i2.p1  ORF type:complete len:455 (+),score=12.78 TRINITY_DN7262_c0_g1_i2:43-1407(+)